MSVLNETDGQHCLVHVRVRCHTTFGQIVAIGGSSNALGRFRLPEVTELVTTPESYPIWYSEKPLVLPLYRDVQYKYGIVEGGYCRSFEVGKHRSFTPTQSDCVIEDIVENLKTSKSGSENIGNRNRANSSINSDFNSFENLEHKVELPLDAKIFIVCFHLPIKIFRTGDPDNPFHVTWSESLIAKTPDSVSNRNDTAWVGTVSVPGGNDSITEDEKMELTGVLSHMKCHPIFIDEESRNQHYKVYCKQVMWPIFHNVDQLDHIHADWHTSDAESKVQSGNLVWKDFTSESYPAYCKVNEIFLNTLEDLIEDGDVVWVHDYHLALLPKMLRDKLREPVLPVVDGVNDGGGMNEREPVGEAEDMGINFSTSKDVNIIFFLHIPFPTSQIFRSLPNAPEVLESLICADLVGFHSFDYTRHFMNACKRMLGIRSHTRPGGVLVLEVGDREVIVTQAVVSIESTQVLQAMGSNEAKLLAANLKAKYRGKKIIIGVDVCNRLSGLHLKFKAFERLLQDYVSTTTTRKGEHSVVLIQKSIRNGARPDDEETTSKELHSLAAALNKKFGGEVISYEELPWLSMSDRVGLWLASDILLLTPVREGLNLMPHEYIFSRKENVNAGVVIASEFSCCISTLNGALKVNPFDAQVVADTLDKALRMDGVERDRRRQRDMNFVASKNSAQWTKQILNEMLELRRFRTVLLDASMHGRMKTSKSENIILTSSSNHVSNNGRFPAIVNPDFIQEFYRVAKSTSSTLPAKARRVFILDYGGTLLHKERYDIYIKQSLSAISGRKPTDRMLDALGKLSEDPHNAVMVITGLTKLKMGNVFDKYPNITLATSNGLVFYWGRNLLTEQETIEFNEKKASSIEDKWQTMDFDIDWETVKEVAIPIMTRFVFRTNGTCLTPRIPGIGWSYFGSDPDWGERQASQLKVELESSLAKLDVKIVSQIQGSLEIVPSKLDKGFFVSQFMDRVINQRAGVLPAMTMVVGDEVSDDMMFLAVGNALRSSGPGQRPKHMRNFTIVVGKRDSPADFYLNDVSDVEELLSRLGDDESTTNPLNDATVLKP